MNRYLLSRILLPFLLVIAIPAGWWSFHHGNVEIDSSAETLLSSDPRNKETFDKIGGLLPDTTLVLVAARIPDLFSNRGAELVAGITEAIWAMPACTEVKSLTHSGRPVRRGMALDIRTFIPMAAEPNEWQALRDFCTRFPMSRNVLVSEDGQYALLLAAFKRELQDHPAREAFRQEFMAVTDPWSKQCQEFHVLSFPFIEAEGYNAMRSDLHRYMIAVSVLSLVILFGAFRSAAAVLLVLTLLAAGIGCIHQLFVLWDRPIDLYTGILFPLVGGLQLTFIVHYLAAFQRFARTMPPPEASTSAMREVFPPSALAALTTMAGLAVLAISNLPQVADVGRIGASAVAAVFALTFAIPLCSLLRRSSTSSPVEPLAPSNPATIRTWLKLRPLIVLLFAAITLAMIPGMNRVRTDVRAVEFLPPDNPIRHTLELLNHELGGINIFQLEIETGRPNGIQELPVLRYMEDLRSYATSIDGVTDAYAYSQLFIALNQLWQGSSAPDGELPTNPAMLMLYRTLINNSPLLFRDAFVGPESSSSLVILRSRDMPGRDYLALLEKFIAFAEKTRPNGVEIRPLQGLHTILEGDKRIVENQSSTLILGLAMVGLLLAILWRSPRLALFALLANMPALAINFGIMGFTGFPLNSVTVMVAVIILGIAVDDAVHLIGYYRRAKRTGLDETQAVIAAVRTKIKPMACTSGLLAVFMGLLILASFPPVNHFGLLSAVALATALAGSTLLLPCLLLLHVQKASPHGTKSTSLSTHTPSPSP